jgi:hypothetical protein
MIAIRSAYLLNIMLRTECCRPVSITDEITNDMPRMQNMKNNMSKQVSMTRDFMPFVVVVDDDDQ